jgi:catechol 2,3-dioxygenase-like lactoylglutathione lyase family enzyme
MSISGIDEVIYGVEDLDTARRFWLDWGLTLVQEAPGQLDFETLNGSSVKVRAIDDPDLPPAIEPGSTVREVTWAVESMADIDRLSGLPGVTRIERHAEITCQTIDPNGLSVRFRVSHKRPVEVRGTPSNTWGNTLRVNQPATIYERATPVDLGHIVFFTGDCAAMEAFYRQLGFVVSDRYPGYAVFLRTADEGGHHDLFILQTPAGKAGLNHVAFSVRDIHEVFGGGMHISRCGWKTQLGPGRHPISSAYFWYVKNPCGGLVEYNTDEDMLTAQWQPREFTPSNTNFAEWAIEGGLDGNTRRPLNAGGHVIKDGEFGTAKRT